MSSSPPTATGSPRLRNYFYTPEINVELCGELALLCRINGTFRARGDAEIAAVAGTSSSASRRQ